MWQGVSIEIREGTFTRSRTFDRKKNTLDRNKGIEKSKDSDNSPSYTRNAPTFAVEVLRYLPWPHAIPSETAERIGRHGGKRLASRHSPATVQ